MAVATTAPEKPVAKKPIVRRITPSRYTFQLLKKYPNHGEGGLADAFIPRNTDFAANWGATNQDEIYWPYKVDDEGNYTPVGFDYEIQPTDQIEYLPRTIRYVYGARSIFKDEQEQGNDAYKLDQNGRNRLLENELNKTNLVFTKGEKNVDASNRTLWQYLMCMNQCENQIRKARDERNNRAKAINFEFKLLDFGYMAEQKVLLGVEKEKAYEIAKSARKEEMYPHAQRLGIKMTYDGTSDRRDFEEVKADYKDFAYNHPGKFIETFNDPRTKIIFQVRELLENDKITLLRTPGQAHWVDTGVLIAQIPPDQDPLEFLASFSMTKEGEEFANNLRALK
jgi:hypothetical protein